MHLKPFNGRAPPGLAGELTALLQTTGSIKVVGNGREEK